MVRRGEVYWAELAPRSGSEQSGRRPVLLVSHDAFNASPGWRSLIVLPITTALQHQGPTTVLLATGCANIPRESLVLAHQITTLDRSKLAGKVGTIPELTMREVERALQNALGIKQT